MCFHSHYWLFSKENLSVWNFNLHKSGLVPCFWNKLWLNVWIWLRMLKIHFKSYQFHINYLVVLFHKLRWAAFISKPNSGHINKDPMSFPLELCDDLCSFSFGKTFYASGKKNHLHSSWKISIISQTSTLSSLQQLEPSVPVFPIQQPILAGNAWFCIYFNETHCKDFHPCASFLALWDIASETCQIFFHPLSQCHQHVHTLLNSLFLSAFMH